jgi:hypothetical protein
MSDNYSTGSEGERLLADYLSARGRVVTRSDKKMFDLIVDGRYAEVKTSRGPYSKLGFIGLTENQHTGTRWTCELQHFIVCNLNDPANLEVIELPAAQLSGEAKS